MFKEFIHWLTYPACTCGERRTCTKKMVIVGNAGIAGVDGDIIKCGKIKEKLKLYKGLGKKK